MEYFNKDSASNSTQITGFRTGLKENAFMLLVFGWSGWGLVIPNLLGALKNKSSGSSLIPILLAVLGFSIYRFEESLLDKFILLISAVTLLTVVDCVRGQFEANAVLHLINGGYLGLGLYFCLMHTYPESFPEIWQTILPTAPIAFNMLLLCFFFQNIGSYVLWNWSIPLNQNEKRYFFSTKNLVNLSFINTSTQQLRLFITLSFLGLLSRIWSFSLGNIYYTEGSGVPFYISSFLAQFDRLYVIAWLYGYALWLQPQLKSNRIVGLTWLLITFELIYQIFSGSKGRFFNSVVLPMASVYILTKRKVSWQSIILLSIIGIGSWLLLYPILVIYRNLLVSATAGASIDPFNTFSRAFQVLGTYSFDTYIEIILTPLNKSGIAEQVVAMTSIIHYQVSQEGSLIWQRLLLFWMPRFIWSNKPITLSGNLIGRLSGRLGKEDFTTSVLTTSPGELYLYYGLLGSALMVLAGLLIRWINEFISPLKVSTPFRVAVFVAFLPLMQGFLSGGFESGLTGIILQLAVLYTILAIAKNITSLPL